MLEYTVINGHDMRKFVSTVDKALSLGWVPQGGISATVINDGGDALYFYCQAFVREKS